MKVTSLAPQIITRGSEPFVEFFEELGFEKCHVKDDIGDCGVMGINMRDQNGFNLDISETDMIPCEATMCIRINVDDFDAAYKLLIERGFKNIYGNRTADTSSAKSAMMALPSGLAINLVQHIKH